MDSATIKEVTKSSGVLDWIKSNWIWIAIGVALLAGIAFFIWKKRKGTKVTVASADAVVDIPAAPQVTRVKQPGQPDLTS